jgi:hypothetical protein
MRFGKSKLARKHGYGNKNTNSGGSGGTEDKSTADVMMMPLELKKES